jgi:signal transduction histidine kinase
MSVDVDRIDRVVSLPPPGEVEHLEAARHIVQFYDDDTVLLDGLSQFIGRALGTGDVGLVIATQPHRDELARRLTARGLDLALAARQGLYVALDAAETLAGFMVDGTPDPARFADLIGGVVDRAAAAGRSGRPGVAAFGEMVALLWERGQTEAALRLEQLWNDLARTRAFVLRCAYPMSCFGRAADAAPIARICAEHARVIPVESYTRLTDDAERSRAIALLQQKARALEAEIAERKRAEEALRAANEELRQALVTRDEFLSVAAHELKTPLTTLRAYAQLLLRAARAAREVDPGRLAIALEAIELQTGKLNQLAGRLLDRAQIEAGKLRIAPVETDLVGLVRAALAQQEAKATGHALIFDGPDCLDARVDPIRFEQVVTNLVENAVKFSPAGSVVTVALGPDPAGDIRLTVTDQGPGVLPDEREAIFGRFHQASGPRHVPGIGLGLYVAREIVELHGGTIRVEDPERPGARFVVLLPPSVRG